MDADVAYADGRLDAWSSWVKGRRGAWPVRTLLGRIIEQGVSGAAQETGGAFMPDSILETDRAVAHLDRLERRVICEYYLTYASSEIKAARCGISRATFWRRLQRGQMSIFRYLKSETVLYHSQAFLRALSV
jgi:DNA-directed RNA polymerase specialized sigma24 family protein